MGCRGHGCCRQVPQSSRQVVPSLHYRQHPHQQRVRQAEVRQYCPAPPDPRLVSQGRRVVLTGDFNNCALRKLPLGCSESQRRISLVEAASGSVRVLRRTLGVTPLWRPGAVLHGHQWPECCGFVVLPGSQNEWLIMKHGSFDIKPAEVGFRSTDQTCNYDQWLHLKNARPKRRRDASPADSNSRRRSSLIRLHLPPPPHPFLPSHLVQPALALVGRGGGEEGLPKAASFLSPCVTRQSVLAFHLVCRPSVRAPGVRPSSCFCSVVNR